MYTHFVAPTTRSASFDRPCGLLLLLLLLLAQLALIFGLRNAHPSSVGFSLFRTMRKCERLGLREAHFDSAVAYLRGVALTQFDRTNGTFECPMFVVEYWKLVKAENI